ncbi:hypothetical protein CGRA01v4_00750 [Colletotrichum graminicola]|nr:hypothetical protein CGRA01v4_00750 [Colletotrichum graminicola]
MSSLQRPLRRGLWLWRAQDTGFCDILCSMISRSSLALWMAANRKPTAGPLCPASQPACLPTPHPGQKRDAAIHTVINHVYVQVTAGGDNGCQCHSHNGGVPEACPQHRARNDQISGLQQRPGKKSCTHGWLQNPDRVRDWFCQMPAL